MSLKLLFIGIFNTIPNYIIFIKKNGLVDIIVPYGHCHQYYMMNAWPSCVTLSNYNPLYSQTHSINGLNGCCLFCLHVCLVLVFCFVLFCDKALSDPRLPWIHDLSASTFQVLCNYIHLIIKTWNNGKVDKYRKTQKVHLNSGRKEISFELRHEDEKFIRQYWRKLLLVRTTQEKCNILGL